MTPGSSRGRTVCSPLSATWPPTPQLRTNIDFGDFVSPPRCEEHPTTSRLRAGLAGSTCRLRRGRGRSLADAAPGSSYHITTIRGNSLFFGTSGRPDTTASTFGPSTGRFRFDLPRTCWSSSRCGSASRLPCVKPGTVRQALMVAYVGHRPRPGDFASGTPGRHRREPSGPRSPSARGPVGRGAGPRCCTTWPAGGGCPRRPATQSAELVQRARACARRAGHGLGQSAWWSWAATLS